MSFSILDVWRPTYFDNILTKIGALPVFDTTSSVKKPYDLTRHHYFNIKEKVGVLSPVRDFLTTNLSMFSIYRNKARHRIKAPQQTYYNFLRCLYFNNFLL